MTELANFAAKVVSGVRAHILGALGLNRVDRSAEVPHAVRLQAEYASIFGPDLSEGSHKLVRVVYRRSANA